MDSLRSVPTTRQLASVVIAAALFFPTACGQSDVDKAKNKVQDAAKSGSADTKRKARELSGRSSAS